MLTLDQINDCLEAYKEGLCSEIDLGGLFNRNEKVHKWKVTYRAIVLRELVAWRLIDLLRQSAFLEKEQFYVGSRVLLRSAIETLSVLLYCTRKMENIVNTGVGFIEFSEKTTNLLLGSRRSDSFKRSINILNVLEFSARKYPELNRAYNDLSETVHPNFDGLSYSYSTVHNKGKLTKFSDKNTKRFSYSQLPIISLLIAIFETEYNDAWTMAFDEFEVWIDKNDHRLI